MYQNSSIFIEENAFESVVCKMAAILSRPQCVNMTSRERHGVEKDQVDLHCRKHVHIMTSPWQRFTMALIGLFITSDGRLDFE